MPILNERVLKSNKKKKANRAKIIVTQPHIIQFKANASRIIKSIDPSTRFLLRGRYFGIDSIFCFYLAAAYHRSHSWTQTYEIAGFFVDEIGVQHIFYSNRTNAKLGYWKVIIDGKLITSKASFKEVVHRLFNWSDGRTPIQHASANSIDFNRLSSAFRVPVVVDLEIDEGEFADDEQELDEDEVESGNEAEIESEPSYDSNPVPVKSKWINSGYDLMVNVFGTSGFIKSADYCLSNVLEDFFVVGRNKVKPASNIVDVPRNSRNIIQDAIRCYNVVTLFKDLMK